MSPIPRDPSPPSERQSTELEPGVEKQIAFATGLFQKDVTIRTLLESLGQAVVVVDNYGYILFVNARAEQMFGYSAREIIGRPHDTFLPHRFHEIHRAHMTHYFQEPRTRPMGLGLDLVAVHRSGREFPVEISLSYVKSQETLLVLALISDVSRRVEADRALKLRAEELAAANMALESFSYSVSHDLRAPLRSLIGLAGILRQDYASQLDEDAASLLERIVSGAEKMRQLIDDMLALSTVSRLELKREEVDVSAMARSIVGELREYNPERTVEIIVHGGLSTHADPKLLRIALFNLVENAWKYTGRTPNPRIEIGGIAHEGTTTFFVRDNGVGFDMRFAAQLFTPFRRLHPQGDFSGTGIGLAITSRVIARHQGRIWAESSPGQGAAFFFELG